jgi:hypothetical protein
MSVRVHSQVSTKHLQQSGYDTPEAALDAAIALRADGASVAYIIEPSDHVFTPTKGHSESSKKQVWQNKSRPHSGGGSLGNSRWDSK